SGTKAAHPNARFTAPASQCPSISPVWEDPKGVPISAFIFGGRLSKNFPLVYEARDWAHGVYLASTMGSEATAAADNQAAIRYDPMAMLPFCGYNMGDYWQHWLDMGSKVDQPPKIFRVNWFRKDGNGKFMWPGFGQNLRVLQWVIGRVRGQVEPEKGLLGYGPRFEDMNWQGIEYDEDQFEALMQVDAQPVKNEIDSQTTLYKKFGDHLPEELERQRQQSLQRLS
ncbi:MAG: phosphoenolpyruvate carboxykinase domain-containing protein, partial [Pseudomonadales bacterium]